MIPCIIYYMEALQMMRGKKQFIFHFVEVEQRSIFMILSESHSCKIVNYSKSRNFQERSLSF